MKKRLYVLLVIIIALAVGCGVPEENFSAVDPSDDSTLVVVVPLGSSTKTIGLILEEAGIIKDSEAFIQTVKDHDVASSLKAGDYKLSKSMSVKEITDIISGGKIYIDTFKFTVPEGFEVRQIIERLSKSGLIDEQIFIDELINGEYNYAFLEDIDRKYMLEGFLFPATYELKTGSSERDIIDAMLGKFDSVFKDEYYDRAKELGMSINDIVAMASIIERETMSDTERDVVAGVFYNRVNKGMLFQSCATVQYVLKDRKPVLSNKDITIDSPYNTYKYKGLTPSPIASPGEAAIKAALYPAKHNYLFFVTKKDGSNQHYFSVTYAEHLRSKAKSEK